VSPEPAGPRRSSWWGPLVLVIAVAALAVAGYALSPHRIAESAASLGPVAAIGAATLLLLALVPRTLVSLTCGALFGAPVGASYALAAAVLAATIAFAAARWLARGVVAQRLRGLAFRLDAWLSRRGLLAVIVVRLVPIAPFGLVSYLYGVTSVRTRHYLAGTLVGAAPSAITWAGVGAAAINPAGIRPLTLLPPLVGLIVTIAAALWWRVSMRRDARTSAADRQQPTRR
jgi:uncharacterized membrane protein YdjX (TVP38/TMEM64 family)